MIFFITSNHIIVFLCLPCRFMDYLKTTWPLWTHFLSPRTGRRRSRLAALTARPNFFQWRWRRSNVNAPASSLFSSASWRKMCCCTVGRHVETNVCSIGKKTKTGRPLFNAKFDILPAVDAAVFASRSWPTQDRHLGNFDNKWKGWRY